MPVGKHVLPHSYYFQLDVVSNRHDGPSSRAIADGGLTPKYRPVNPLLPGLPCTPRWLYISATDTAPADDNVLTINLVNSNPADGSLETQTAGGAVVSWSP